MLPSYPNAFGAIFDMDGVLVDSNALHLRAFQALGRRLGVDFTEQFLQQTVGMHNNQILPLWLGSHLGAALNAARIEELAQEKESLYRGYAAQELTAVEGVLDFIKVLEENHIPLAVGSSGPRENVELALGRLGLKHRMSAVVTGSDIKHGKSNPEVFLKAAAGLNIAPERCIVFEDAVVGVQAALSAGCRAVAITTSNSRAALSKAHIIIDRFDELTIEALHQILISSTTGQ